MKVAILGCGKRFRNVYYKILQGLGYEIFLWNRTQEKSQLFCHENTCSLIKDLSEINDIKPDLVLCFIPSRHQYDILSKLTYTASPILLETPAEDQRILSLDLKIGVLEQWPKLPLEQFKELVYSSGLMTRPYMVMNDGRSFDYHAIAQLRTYMGLPIPVIAKGSLKNYQNVGVIDNSGKLNTNLHDWTVGQIEMSNGGILLYSFSYTCKSLLSIPIQFLRAISTDGSITSGRMKEIGNDYEIIDLRIVDKVTKAVEIYEVKVDRNNNTTNSISAKSVNWNNPFSSLSFDDQQTAIATVIVEALSGKLYSYKDAFIDQVCINMMKQSGLSQQVVQLSR